LFFIVDTLLEQSSKNYANAVFTSAVSPSAFGTFTKVLAELLTCYQSTFAV